MACYDDGCRLTAPPLALEHAPLHPGIERRTQRASGRACRVAAGQRDGQVQQVSRVRIP